MHRLFRHALAASSIAVGLASFLVALELSAAATPAGFQVAPQQVERALKGDRLPSESGGGQRRQSPELCPMAASRPPSRQKAHLHGRDRRSLRGLVCLREALRANAVKRAPQRASNELLLGRLAQILCG